jgi:hypothetical protein
MDLGYYLSSFGFFLTLLILMSLDPTQLIALLKLANFSQQFKDFFLLSVPDKSILSYLITSIFGIAGIILGNTIINQGKFYNQINELKKVLYFLIDNQISSIDLIITSLVTIRSLLREIHPILSDKECVQQDRDKDLVRNFWSNLAFLKRTIEKLEKDSLYNKLLVDRKSLKSETNVIIENYFSKLKSLLIDLETLVLSNFPDSRKEVEFQWRNTDLVNSILEDAITQFSVLICIAEMCGIVLFRYDKNKEALVNKFCELINPNKSPFEYHKIEMIRLNEFEMIEKFIDNKCRKQKLKCCNLPQLTQSARTKIQISITDESLRSPIVREISNRFYRP